MNHAGGERLNAEWARRLRAPFGTLRSAAAPALPGGSAGALAQAFHRDPLFSGCVLAVAPNPAALEAFLGDAEVFRGRDGHLRAYPMLSGADDTEAAAARLSLLRILDAKSPPPVLIGTCVQALLQPSPDPRRTDELSRELKPGPDEGPEALVAWLEANGYQRGPEVYERGIYAVKGGIVDVWPTAAGVPSRIEYFGDDIESLRTFHPETQRSDQPLESLRIPPRRLPARSRGLLHHYLPDATIVLWLDWPTAENEAAAFAETGGLADNRRLGAVRDALDKRAGVRQFFFGEPGPDGAPAVTLPLQIFTTCLKFHFTEFWEDTSEGSVLRCPQCYSEITNRRSGICPKCHANAFQCRGCRHINYNYLDGFICCECGSSNFVNMEWAIKAIPSFSHTQVNSYEDVTASLEKNEELLTKAHDIFSSLNNMKSQITALSGLICSLRKLLKN